MSETKFEVLERYRMRDGRIARVTRIYKTTDDDPYPVGFFIEGDHHAGEMWATVSGTHSTVSDDPYPYDLLLPAIGPEVAGDDLSEPTVTALKAYREFWNGFRVRVLSGDVDATNGLTYPLLAKSGGCVVCNYATGLDAISDASAVIAAVDALLEGGAR